MVSFRRLILAVAVLALFTGLASAQVVGGGSTGGTMTCAANVANPTAVRVEGLAELLGDIVIQCSGGTLNSPGSLVPTANITVSLSNTTVSSRILNTSTNQSEALLFIDEPGAAGATGPGTSLPQSVCNVSGTVPTQGAGAGGCTTYANTSTPGSAFASTCSSFTGSVCTTFGATPNVFQGIVQGNQVIFNGVPILAPVTAGFARVFRITNVRANASALGQGTSGNGTVGVLASVTIGTNVLLTNPVQTVAFVFNGLASTAVRNAGNTNGTSSMLSLAQCGSAGLTAGSVLRFTEGFANAYKTRVQPTGSYSGAATSGNNVIGNTSFTQNQPGTIYNGSESGLIFNVTGQNTTAGLADFGTRLKATFNNIPSNFQIFVSTTNLNPGGNTGAPANTQTNTSSLNQALGSIPLGSSNLLAGLVTSETATTAQGNFLPLANSTNNSSGTILFGPLTVSNGTASAVWEILTTNPSLVETAEFAVYYMYTGDPQNNKPEISPNGTVTMGFAPQVSSTYIPRFITPSTAPNTLISFVQCSTTLLYPYITAKDGLDTGIAIANTSSDPFGTRQQNGTCTLNFYGDNQGTPNTSTTTTVNAGATYVTLASALRPNFQGYVIATCNFQLAHGFALVSDIGLHNFATTYLALVMPRGTGNRNAENLNYSPTTATEAMSQ